ncbi:hypothetical protein BSL78_26557 [Apostichopus japonicus]|uniref:DUF4097 domain-containing protein n=1 Tax=Stichopus japonicus TaxID=307972 RepID=A0A2G8JLI4_STIJA|nr:hypothetical protein BSL78_26557 [Apostichopus japonicus]
MGVSSAQSIGLLSIETDKSVEINRINVLQHPGGDFAAFHLVRRDTRAMPDKAELLVNYDEERNRLSLVDNNVRERSCDERWVLEVPPYYDLTVQHTGDEADAIRVENLENQTITIQSVGNIHVHNLKSRDIVLDTTEGEVKSTKVLQGNAVIKTRKDKGFTADRLQGQRFDIQTEDGNVLCKDIYGNTSSVLSQTGKLNLGNVTGECSLSTAGNVAIGSMDGSLEVNVSHSGSVQAYLVRPASVSITTDKGDVSVSLPLDVKCHLNLTATNISVPDEMSLQVEEVDNLKKMRGAHNEGQSPVSVCSKEGSISVSVQSWFDSLKLGS